LLKARVARYFIIALRRKAQRYSDFVGTIFSLRENDIALRATIYLPTANVIGGSRCSLLYNRLGSGGRGKSLRSCRGL
jgi:hypothetical protein